MRARLSMVLLAAAVLAAQEHMPHDHGAVTGLGTLHFPISCSAAAQAKFTRAVAWLHSFGYEQAEALFSQIGANEPECGMAYWGAAKPRRIGQGRRGIGEGDTGRCENRSRTGLHRGHCDLLSGFDNCSLSQAGGSLSRSDAATPRSLP